MIYLLAPYNLSINTTSRNRTLSYYYALKAKTAEVKIINPPILKRDTELRTKGILNGSTEELDLISPELKESGIDALISKMLPGATYKVWAAILNLIFISIKGYDFYYPVSSLKRFFSDNPLNQDDILVVSGPPFSLFSAGAELSEKYRCTLILDYRDPWTYGYAGLDSRPFFNLIKSFFQRRTENRCLQIAGAAICDSFSLRKLFPKKHNYKVGVILNGANLQAIHSEKIVDRPGTFRIVYLGTIYNDQLADNTFFRALAKAIEEKKMPAAELQLLFVGSNPNPGLEQIIKEFNLEKYTVITPRLSLTEAIDMAYNASVFLHLRYGNRTTVESSKHLDYLALQKPILLPVSDNGNVAASIRQHNAGYLCHNLEECYNTLLELWEKYLSGESFRIFRNNEFLHSISREHESEKLFNLIEGLKSRSSDSRQVYKADINEF